MSAVKAKTNIALAPSMLFPQEQNFLKLLGEKYYCGEGAIFDVGYCRDLCSIFCAGLKEQYFTHKEVIHVYEWGRCTDEYLIDFIAQHCGKELVIGDSFADIVVKNLSSCSGAEYIKPHIGDILLQTYPEVIEIFFLDVCKTSEINHAMTQLFSRGIPGKSIVIHQDFVHEWLPWIHVTMGYLHEYFEPIGNLMYSFVFLHKKEISKEVLEYIRGKTCRLIKKVECI